MPISGIRPVLLALAAALIALPAAAQSDTPAALDDAAGDLASLSALGDALTIDPAALPATPPAALKLPRLYDKTDSAYSRDDRADGSSTFTLKKPLPVDLETKVGADLAPAPRTVYAPGQPLPGTGGADSGAAWASVGVNNLASIDARIDPNNEQSKVATTLQRALPIGGKLSVTVQETLSVTDTYSARSAEGGAVATTPTQIWGRENRLKFDILPTGTSLAAGLATSSIDPVAHNSFSADQKLYGPLHVTTAVNDVGQPTASKSVTAAFKVNW